MYTLSRCLQTIIKRIAMHCLHKLSISNFNMFLNLRNQQAQNILFDLETYINHHVFHSTLVRIVQLPDHTIPLSVLWSSLQFHVFIDMPLHDYFIFLLVYHFLCSPVFCMLLLSFAFILGCYHESFHFCITSLDIFCVLYSIKCSLGDFSTKFKKKK